MKFEKQTERPLCPAGEQVLTFKGCELVEFDPNPNPKFKNQAVNKNGKVDKARWNFTSNLEDDDTGLPFEFSVLTGLTGYGNPKAGLTKICNNMVPGMTEAKFDDFDSDDFIGKKFTTNIQHVKKESGDGMKADYLYLSPVKGAVRPTSQAKNGKPAPIQPDAPISNDHGFGDPFADDE